MSTHEPSVDAVTGSRMRPMRQLISLDEGRAIITRTILSIDRIEQIPLLQANGRVLAEAAIAPADVPPFTRAGMDGYAVRSSDTTSTSRETPVVLTCIEQVFTAQIATRTVGPGQCTEVATGAPMPPGADAVVIVEDTFRRDDQISAFSAVHSGQNVGPQGSDIRKGQQVLGPGDVLNASRVGALAALGLESVLVYAKPRVAILSTGNEIVEPGRPLAPGQLYDINRFTLAAVVAEHGGEPVPLRVAADTLSDLNDLLDQCGDADILAFSGGSSVGERDLILDLLVERGTLLFHGLKMKPGKPTAFGTVGDAVFFGLPGYPTSCLSNGYILLVPALRQMARLPPRTVRTVSLPLGRRVTSVAGRHQFYTVRLDGGQAMPAFKASGDITSMSLADGYIEIDADTEAVEAGTVVQITLF